MPSDVGRLNRSFWRNVRIKVWQAGALIPTFDLLHVHTVQVGLNFRF